MACGAAWKTHTTTPWGDNSPYAALRPSPGGLNSSWKVSWRPAADPRRRMHGSLGAKAQKSQNSTLSAAWCAARKSLGKRPVLYCREVVIRQDGCQSIIYSGKRCPPFSQLCIVATGSTLIRNIRIRTSDYGTSVSDPSQTTAFHPIDTTCVREKLRTPENAPDKQLIWLAVDNL